MPDEIDIKNSAEFAKKRKELLNKIETLKDGGKISFCSPKPEIGDFLGMCKIKEKSFDIIFKLVSTDYVKYFVEVTFLMHTGAEEFSSKITLTVNFDGFESGFSAAKKMIADEY